ncbi:MAG: tRNA preQ1(34) S-adenosylmethionine ribosyltransferase-isomerase QueA [Lachnospiraceae bacterium]|nr:tRNA preQ1(34) S-adenosylmethionine ribosyltransferase-isomerase QueA [Candidatus Hippenecus merdae]
MDVKDFDYELPEELIAQDPLKTRSDSRLMVLNRADGSVRHMTFTDVKKFMEPGDCLVINDTKVIPARLLGVKKETGAKAEVLLLNRQDGDIWECLVKPGRKLKKGTVITFGDGRLECEVVDEIPDGNRMVKFRYEGIWEEVLDALGEMPLPPYITHKLKDRDRYQTVYATHEGSAAAPTAGLHFTKELLKEIEESGVKIARVTLHVGLGTFRPVKVDKIEDHHMHSEVYFVSKEAADIVNETKASGHRVIAVGTTSVRTLESAAVKKDGKWVLEPCSGDTAIFIYPGYEWKLVDRLITNFHLPQSTLIMLVSALAGRENVLNAYKQAVGERYRFFSFGDAMLII